MRSGTPKALHDLCGRPMLLWPVSAALAAGAGRVVVVDTPARALEPLLPEGVELAVQQQPDGTGGAVAAAMAMLGSEGGASLDPAAPVLVLSGDVPLVSAEAIGELVEAHRASGAAATMATTILEDPTGYGRVVRDSGGAVERVVETRREGDATQAEREIREVNTGIFAFAADALSATLPRLSAENAQGELYLPQVLDLLRRDGAAVAAHAVADERLVLQVNDRVALAHVRRLAQAAIHERHMHAGVGIVDPDATVIEVDVQIGQDTLIEPFTRVATQTLPAASTARLSKRWKPPSPATIRPPCGEGNGAFFTTPGATTSNAQSRAVSVSATYSVLPSGDRPMPFGVRMGCATSTIFDPSGRAK